MPALTKTLALKVTIVIVAGSFAFTGASAAAAYNGILQASLQESTDALIGETAPDPDAVTDDATVTETDVTETDGDDSTDDPTAEPGSVGPKVEGKSFHGLCNAYAHGGLGEKSTARGNLVAAAGGEDNVSLFCLTVEFPGKSAKHQLSATPSPEEPEAPEAPEAAEETQKSSTEKSGHASGKADNNGKSQRNR